MRLFSSTCFLSFVILFAACASNILSSSAKLLQSPTEFGDDSILINVSHDCSGERCIGFDASFENLSAETIEIVLANSTLTRAGASLKIVRSDKKHGNIVIPPKSTVSEYLELVSLNETQKMSYVLVKEVVCSLKFDDACKDRTRGEGRCLGYARYYFKSHNQGGGWITLFFAIKPKSHAKPYIVSNKFTTEAFAEPPTLNLSSDTDAPFWGSTSDEVVFYKVFCDAHCNCKDVEKPPNFINDHRFMPIPK